MATFAYLFLISILALIDGRPPTSQQLETPTGLQQQGIVEQTSTENIDRSSERKIDADTRKILDKIAEVNKKQGLTFRKQTPHYFHFPFSYSRSQEQNIKRPSDFQYSNPFSNPIFEYLEREKHYDAGIRSSDYDTRQSQEINEDLSSMFHSNAEVTKDDIIPNHYIKRKIVHQQSILIPNYNFFSTPYMPPQNYFGNILPLPVSTDIEKSNFNNNKGFSTLEKQTIQNIRNIVSNSQSSPPNRPYQNRILIPYQYSTISQPPQYGFLNPTNNFFGQISNANQIYEPFSAPKTTVGRQNWPFQQYFPIHIRDPFVQMFNAITSMVEYGPGAGVNNPCPGRPNRKDNLLREAKISNSNSKVILELTTENTPPIGKDHDGSNTTWDRIKTSAKSTIFTNTTRTNNRLSEGRPITLNKFPPVKKEPVISPPQRDPTKQTVEFGTEEEEEEKSEIISNDGNKKLFSRDNTGSGVFIHRLKVRKGGVAIAGPGGIATAGSGGTAIVGPNGIAYTHPDSLAIAGSGTKVVAVDPTINLRDLISDSVRNNRTKGDTISRVGKVVAVGPVVYYNKG